MKFKEHITYILFLCVSVGAFVSCEDYDFAVDESHNRLFRPPVAEATEVKATSALLNWVKVNGTHKYIVEFSQDSLEFNDVTTFEVSAKYDSLRVVDLYSEALYSYRVKAIDTTGLVPASEFISAYFKTPGEQIFKSYYQTLDKDLNANITKLHWVAGEKVTAISVQAEGGEVEEIALTAEELLAGEKVLTHLESGTNYLIKILRDGKKRGSLSIHTYEAYPAGYIFLAEGASVADALAGAPANAALVLSSSATFDAGKLAIPGHIESLEIWGEPDTISATLVTTSIVPSLIMTRMRIKNLIVDGVSSGSNYLMNIGETIALTDISLEDCNVHSVRGLFRMQKSGNETVINSFRIHNCVISDVGGYGIFNTKGTPTKMDNISITNSTFYNVEQFARIDGATTGVVDIKYCTFYNTISKGKYLFEFFVDEAEITATFNCSNLVFGKFWYEGAYDGTSFVRSSNNFALFTFTDSYATSDFVVDAAYPFNLLNTYGGSSTDVFADPNNADKPDFTLIDPNFPGNNTAGDPRWWLK